MVVFVTGTPKGGTSYITELIHEIGFESVVDRVAIVPGVSRDYNINESYAVNMLNNKIITEIDGGDSAILYTLKPFFTAELSEATKVEIRQYIAKLPENCVIKDPRFIATLRFWLEELPENRAYKIVWVRRLSTDNMARSLEKDEWSKSKLVWSASDHAQMLKNNLEDAIKWYNQGTTISFELALHKRVGALRALEMFLS